MIEGGTQILLESVIKGEISGVIGLGGANGTDLVCSILRALPYLVPKIMISAVAGTAAVQWCIAESDICMYPSIGDVSLNRVTKLVMENAAWQSPWKPKTGPLSKKPRRSMRHWSRSRRSEARRPASNT